MITMTAATIDMTLMNITLDDHDLLTPQRIEEMDRQIALEAMRENRMGSRSSDYTSTVL